MSTSRELEQVRADLKQTYLDHWRRSGRRTLLVRADCGIGKTHQLAAAIAEILQDPDGEGQPEDDHVA